MNKETQEEAGKYFADNADLIININRETLEDAIYKIFKSKEYSNVESNPNAIGFMIAGAQEGANWQAERMYSEEEVKDIVEQTIEKFYKHTYADKTKAEMKELWLEQFKKK